MPDNRNHEQNNRIRAMSTECYQEWHNSLHAAYQEGRDLCVTTEGDESARSRRYWELVSEHRDGCEHAAAFADGFNDSLESHS